MKSHKKRAAPPLPFMLAEMAVASWETMMIRSMMMATGNCSMIEYQRMVLEKTHAAQLSAKAMMASNGDVEGALAPWHSRAVANAKRLRRR
jgi:hypothetical protein